MAGRVELDLPAEREYLGVVRTVVSELAGGPAALPEARVEDVRLAVTEACANAVDAIQRSHPDPATATVSVRCWLCQDRVVVEVHDDAGGFDPSDLLPHPPVATPARLQFERGLGIPLMRALADEVRFEPSGKGTTVHLVFRPRP
jgi:anti-sigma regulatory factor (Ser/Thr protein kinase)